MLRKAYPVLFVQERDQPTTRACFVTTMSDLRVTFRLTSNQCLMVKEMVTITESS